MTARRLILGAIGLLLLIGFGWAFRPVPVAVDSAAVARGSLMITIGEEARTRVRDVYVVSAPVTGRLLRIGIRPGDAVSAGASELATVMPSDPGFLDARAATEAQAAVKSAQQAVAAAQAQATLAESEAARAESLSRTGTLPKAELDRARMNLAARQAELRLRQAELEMAQARLIDPAMRPGAAEPLERAAYLVVRAPVSGQVLRIVQESETVVAAGTPLLEIGDVGDLEIVIELRSTEAVQVQPGMSVLIDRWGGAGSLNGTVRRIEPFGFTKVSALGIEEQRVNVIVDFNDDPSRWRALGHGYRVEARIVIWQASDVLLVPTSALFRRGEAWAVFVFENGVARVRSVELGQRSPQQAQVISGLDEGARVVLHPSDRIAEGVRLVERRVR